MDTKTKTSEESIAEHIELLVELIKVKSSVKENVTEDYVLAQLRDFEREYITENYENAEFAKNILGKYRDKGYEYKFDEKKFDWYKNDDGSYKKVKISEEDYLKIKLLAERLFGFFMIKPDMVSVLNRNRDNNFIIKLLGKDSEEEKPVVYGQDDRSILQKIKDKMEKKGDENI